MDFVDFPDERAYGPIVVGSECSSCGSELVRTARGHYCDWCMSIVDGAATDQEEEDDDDADSGDET